MFQTLNPKLASSSRLNFNSDVHVKGPGGKKEVLQNCSKNKIKTNSYLPEQNSKTQLRLNACPFQPSRVLALEQVINRISYQVVQGLLVVKHESKTCYTLIHVRNITQVARGYLKTCQMFQLTMEMLSLLLWRLSVKKISGTAYHRHACVASRGLFIAALQIGSRAHQTFQN